MNDNYEQYVLVLGVIQCIHFRVGVGETDGGRSLAPKVLEESLRVKSRKLRAASVYLFTNFVRNLQLCVQEQLPELYTYEPLLAVLPLPSFENSV